jgi:ATP/maltotriose-dependent transcriptional regulator MalT
MIVVGQGSTLFLLNEEWLIVAGWIMAHEQRPAAVNHLLDAIAKRMKSET